MKNILFITLFVITSIQNYAAQGGPDSWGYTWKDNNQVGGPNYNWIDVVNQPGATQVKLLGDDNSRGPFQMNFDFHYYWYDVNQFYVGSNGYILFQQGQLASIFYNLPNTNWPNDIIGPFMNDISFEGDNNPAQCWYWINNDHDTLIVSWVDVPFWTPPYPHYSGSNSFQLILSKVDSSITFQYADQQGSAYNSYVTRVGIENNSGSIGLGWNTVFPSSINPPINYAIKFFAPPNPSLQITDATTTYNDNTITGGIFLPVSNSLHSLNAQIKNCGNVVTNPFAVNVVVINPASAMAVNTITITDTLQPQQSESIIFNSSLLVDMPGTYKFTTSCQLSGDNVVSNNSQTQEIVAIDTSQVEMILRYDGGQVFGYQGFAWVGGYGSIAMYFIPPFYPVKVTQLHYRNSGVANNSTFATRVFDDDGAQGLPFTLLDSIYVAPADVVTNGWTTLTLPVPIIIYSGGFYITWDEQGENIFLDMATGTPFSHRALEGINNDFGIFRYNQSRDPMITATIEHSNQPIGITMASTPSLQLQLFPNPCSGDLNLVYSTPENRVRNVIVVFDIQGKERKVIDLNPGGGFHEMHLDVSDFSNGIYFAELLSGNKKVMRKLVVVN